MNQTYEADKLKAMREASSEIIAQTIRDHKIHRDDFFNQQYRPQHIVVARWNAIERLYKAGIMPSVIAEVLGRSASSVARVITRLGIRKLKQGTIMVKPDERIEAIINEIAEKHKTSLDVICGNGRWDHLVAARKEIAVTLEAMGYTPSYIGYLINRHHSTVAHYLDNGRRTFNSYFRSRAYKGLSLSAREAVLREAQSKNVHPRKVINGWIEERAKAA